MLKQRVLTALVLLAILLPALFYPDPEPFMVVVLVLYLGWRAVQLTEWAIHKI